MTTRRRVRIEALLTVLALVALALAALGLSGQAASAGTTRASAIAHTYDAAPGSRADVGVEGAHQTARPFGSDETDVWEDLAQGTSTTVIARGVATNSARGLSDFGGVIEQTGTNAAGGRIFTSTGGIAQNDFAGIVNSGLMRGEEVTILSGAHGAANGSLVADATMFADDVAEFGLMPGVRVLDVSTMSAAEIRAAIDGPGTIIGGFCNSGACLAPYGG